jgi:hypothetical protein
LRVVDRIAGASRAQGQGREDHEEIAKEHVALL